MRKTILHFADVKHKIRKTQTERRVSKSTALNVPEILDRMKSTLSLKTDAELALHLGVSNKTISSWRTRNSLPIESVLQIVDEKGKSLEYFLLGSNRQVDPDLDKLFSFNDLRVRDFELAGETILASVLGQFAEEELAFMTEKELRENGDSLGATLMTVLALIRQERRALLDTGKLDEIDFEKYVRKAFRTDLPYRFKAIRNRTKSKGPQ